MSLTLSLIDYGMGNLGSVRNMFKRLGINTQTISDPSHIHTADKLLLPGVGAFDNAITKLSATGMDQAILEYAKTGKYVLGICLGMQLLTTSSEEGKLPGLNLVPGTTNKFLFDDDSIKIPHMGWNVIQASTHPIFNHFDTNSRFYFVHSYHVNVQARGNSLATTDYNGKVFDSMIIKDNVLGAQFHPEKSHKYGMQLLKGFAEL